MNEKSVKERAMAGEKVYGVMLTLVNSTGMVHIAKNAGLDYILYDCEHGFFNSETLLDGYLLCNALGIEGWARVPIHTKDYISRILDSGASGIMAPMIETVEQAKQLVKYSKYAPIGGRGVAGSTPQTGYRSLPMPEMMADRNRRVTAMALIETALGIENAMDIAAVDGIDMLGIGPADLSVSLGFPGDVMNPVELEAIAKVIKACRAHKKLFTMPISPDLPKNLRDEVDVVMQSGDVGILRKGCEEIRAILQ